MTLKAHVILRWDDSVQSTAVKVLNILYCYTKMLHKVNHAESFPNPRHYPAEITTFQQPAGPKNEGNAEESKIAKAEFMVQRE